MKNDNDGCLVILSLVPIIGIGWLATKLFEYSLWVLTGRNIVWYMDLVGAVFCNAFLLPMSFVLWLLVNAFGYTVPLLH